MKSFSFAYVLSSVILAANFAFAADGQGHQLSSETSTSLRQAALKMVFAQSSTVGRNQSGGERSIIIVSGKNAKTGSVGSPGSKVMLNPQPLPPRTNVNTSVNSNASKVMLNPQPLPPKPVSAVK
jgi:hypothetical protein